MRQVELPDEPMGRVAMWFQDSVDKEIRPGGTQDGFRIESSCKPGFTTALFGSGILVNIDQELPAEVFAQLKFYDDPTWAKPPALTFGPMFCQGVSSGAVVHNFTSGVQRLVDLHVLSSKSAFVADVASSLRVGGSAPINHPPSDESERELFTALQLSLSLPLRTEK